MIGYQPKGEIQLTWMDNRDELNLQVRKIMRRVVDSAMAELSSEFLEAQKRGELLEISHGTDELKRLLLKAAQRELGSGVTS